jgi:hypothetical protein
MFPKQGWERPFICNYWLAPAAATLSKDLLDGVLEYSEDKLGRFSARLCLEDTINSI